MTETQNEATQAQIPALELLIKLGYTYLPPAEALRLRGGRTHEVLLTEVLRAQLPRLNRIQFRGQEYPFSPGSIQSALEKLQNPRWEGLQATSEALYDLLTLGATEEESLDGATRSFPLRYIDWREPANNVYHVTAEYEVRRNRSQEHIRPDLVLFVNGIPLAVVECKARHVELSEAVSQMVRNQKDAYAPRLFSYAQLLLAVNGSDARYGAVGAPSRYWGQWRELEDAPETVEALVNQPLPPEAEEALLQKPFAPYRAWYRERAQQRTEDSFQDSSKETSPANNWMASPQDQALHSLCRPERLLELAYGYTLFDNRVKKVARYQQYFVVRATLKRIQQRDRTGRRKGGVIWHTQGSGKSLTMVMLVRALAQARQMQPELAQSQILLVTDRKDLDRQLGNTFRACGLQAQTAKTSRQLMQYLREGAGLVTTLVHKFERGLSQDAYTNPSSDIFVLVDESHRTHYGNLAGSMRKVLPNACYIAFTGTPLHKEERSTFNKFGDMIQPVYSIRQAVEDGAVAPLLYEGRHDELDQNSQQIDQWFNRVTLDLTDQQKKDLRRKWERSGILNQADQVIYNRAFDISNHFRRQWRGTGFKAQLVAPSKEAALKYQQYLRQFSNITTEVVMSPPDTREGHEEVDESKVEPVQDFWRDMMTRYRDAESYESGIIERFKHSDEPEILIVIDKLLTGFDAPRNTVLYLCKPLREHTLLQAIARVNRLYEKEEAEQDGERGEQQGGVKEYGYIVDYVRLLGELDRALTDYDKLAGFAPEDLEGAVTPVRDAIANLPQLLAELQEFFKSVPNRYDQEALESHLRDEARRHEFYELLRAYSKQLHLALGSEHFLNQASEEELARYKSTLKKSQKLKQAVQHRYGETVDFKKYDPQIRKLIDQHVLSEGTTVLNEPVDIFNKKQLQELVEATGTNQGKTAAARADMIASNMKREINERLEEDPVYYQSLSAYIEQAIADYNNQKITELEYLQCMQSQAQDLQTNQRADIPSDLRENAEAAAFYGVIHQKLAETDLPSEQMEEAGVKIASAIQAEADRLWKVDFWNDPNAENELRDALDNYYYDVIRQTICPQLSAEVMDYFIDQALQIMRRRRA